MRKFWMRTVMIMTTVGALTACSDDDEPEVEPTVVTTTEGVYVINTGDWGMNNGTVQWYDPETQTVSTDLFAAANGKGIGDVQDLIVYGNKVYIACTSSAKIEIVSRSDFSIIKTLNLANSEGEAIEPRYLAAADGAVYFTAYDGTVSRVDTTSLSITGSVNVGDHPEALTVANGKLYVNISGYGAENKIAVVNLSTFTKTKDIEVVINPYEVCFTADDGYVYFVSAGNYRDIDYTLQRLDPQTDAVTELFPAVKAAVKDDKIYYIYTKYNAEEQNKVAVYDMTTGTHSEFVPISTFGGTPQFIAVDPVSGHVYIGDYAYGVTNDVFVFDSTGAQIDSFESGNYTNNVRFVTKETVVE